MPWNAEWCVKLAFQDVFGGLKRSESWCSVSVSILSFSFMYSLEYLLVPFYLMVLVPLKLDWLLAYVTCIVTGCCTTSPLLAEEVFCLDHFDWLNNIPVAWHLFLSAHRCSIACLIFKFDSTTVFYFCIHTSIFVFRAPHARSINLFILKIQTKRGLWVIMQSHNAIDFWSMKKLSVTGINFHSFVWLSTIKKHLS